jgi:uncharacterized protein (DUF4213/DUF364 family)
MGMCEGRDRKPGWDDISRLPEEWNLYKDLIAGIPEDVGVKDVCIGSHWVLVEAESGCGMSLTVSGGYGSYGLGANALYMSLRDLACQTTSWNFMEASVGVAALNAWYSTPEHASAAGMKMEQAKSNDGFDLYRSMCTGRKVTVVGHFPLIERLADECELTVLEREPRDADLPDPACEFVIPHQDAVFMTGITLTNKTMPRLLQLAGTSHASTILVGPSVVPAPVLYEYGVDCMAGSVIDDPERAKASIMHGCGSSVFGHGVQKMRVERPGWLDSLR